MVHLSFDLNVFSHLYIYSRVSTLFKRHDKLGHSLCDQDLFSGQQRKQPSGVRRDKQLLPTGELSAGFAANRGLAVAESGYSNNSCDRARAVIAEVVSEQSNKKKVEDMLAGEHDFLLIKRSQDEPPVAVACLFGLWQFFLHSLR